MRRPRYAWHRPSRGAADFVVFGAWLLIAYCLAGRWLTDSPGPVVQPVWLLAGVLVVSAASLWLMVAHRRRVWGIAAAVALASGALGFTGLKAGKHAAPPLVPFNLDNWAVAEPVAPFADAAGNGVLGWRWVYSDENWRRALVVRPPHRLTRHITVRGQEPLRFFLATMKQTPVTTDPPPRVRCSAVAVGGKTIGRQSRVLRAGDTPGAFGPWEELTLDLSGAAGSEVKITLEVKASGPGTPSAPLPEVAIAPLPPTPPTTSEGPNCVFILVDTLRADRLHCYGYPRKTSPHIDALAEEGILFEQVISASSWTVPSVASLFTGTYVSTHGMSNNRMPARMSLPTLAERLHEAGVRTAAVSANLLVTPAGGYGPGFDEFVGVDSNETSDCQEDAPPADWVTDHAKMMLNRLSEQRFFLYVHYMDPHDPYTPPAKWALFGQDDHQRYLGEIRYCDDRIGRLLDHLDALGCTENTLVVLTADHGEAFMEHGGIGHGMSVHREEVEVPLILRYPGVVPAGRRVVTRVRSIDAHATIAELMGLSVARHVEGESLVPLMRGTGPVAHRACVSELHSWTSLGSPSQVSRYEGDRKLIAWLKRDRRALYDTSLDRGERNNLAAEEPGRVGSMKRSIRRFLKMREKEHPANRPQTEAERARLKSLGYLDPGAPVEGRTQ